MGGREGRGWTRPTPRACFTIDSGDCFAVSEGKEQCMRVYLALDDFLRIVVSVFIV